MGLSAGENGQCGADFIARLLYVRVPSIRTGGCMQEAGGQGTDIFGLYELSNEGTILYSRVRVEDGLGDAEPATVGQDFFSDIFTCRNVDDLRRHFRRFVSGDRPVDTFVFDGLFDDEVLRTKIFMTRAYENDRDHAGEIVIMDIRRAA